MKYTHFNYTASAIKLQCSICHIERNKMSASLSVFHLISNSNGSIIVITYWARHQPQLCRHQRTRDWRLDWHEHSYSTKRREMIKINDDKWWYHCRQQQRPSLLLSVLYKLRWDIWDTALQRSSAKQDLFWLKTIQSREETLTSPSSLIISKYDKL